MPRATSSKKSFCSWPPVAKGIKDLGKPTAGIISGDCALHLGVQCTCTHALIASACDSRR